MTAINIQRQERRHQLRAGKAGDGVVEAIRALGDIIPILIKAQSALVRAYEDSLGGTPATKRTRPRRPTRK